MKNPVVFFLANCFVGFFAFTPLAHSAPLEILVPAYFYPIAGPSGAWARLSSAATQVRVNAIMNPFNGPGVGQNPDYLAATTSFKNSGGILYGYVYTSYGSRNLTDIKTDIDAYLTNYSAVDGIFLDEMASDAGSIATYAAIHNYIKGINPNLRIIGNAGVNADEIYLQQAIDTLVSFENTWTNYAAYQPTAWSSNYAASSFAHIAHSATTLADMESVINAASSKNGGMVYVTDDQLPNPYDLLPSYWDQEVALIQQLNLANHSVPIPATLPLFLFGVLLLIRRNRINTPDIPNLIKS